MGQLQKEGWRLAGLSYYNEDFLLLSILIIISKILSRLFCSRLTYMRKKCLCLNMIITKNIIIHIKL